MATHHSHATDPTVSHGRGGECQSWPYQTLSFDQFEQQAQEMCSQTVPRKLLPSATICLQYVRLRSTMLSLAPRFAAPTVGQPQLRGVPSHNDIMLINTCHYQLRGRRNYSSRTNWGSRRWRILLWRAFLSMTEKWLILMDGCSAAEQETLMELWSLYREHHMTPMLCLHLQSGALKTPITPEWVIFAIYLFPLLQFDESFLFPRIFLSFVTASSHSIKEPADWTDQINSAAVQETCTRKSLPPPSTKDSQTY